ncbi:MAG TPA: TMEM175 family protein [Candidatus Omnitrophota bacterium]|nr:TMEM175 family protein [Candidatus Omnitrophota bacterium]
MDTQAGSKVIKYGVFTKNRVEAFSDGIFAILVTLLVLELRTPHIEHADSARELFAALAGLLPKFLSWVISFVTICIIWRNHHRLFDMFKGINNVIFWLNVQMLLCVCFVPFPTALVGDYPHNPLAAAFYGIVMALSGAAFIATRVYSYKHRELLKDNLPLDTYKSGIIMAFWVGPVAYLAGAALAWVNTYLSFAVYFLIAIYFVFSFAAQEGE